MKIVIACDHIVKTGFARVAEALCNYLFMQGHEVNVHALGYDGGYHDKEYRVWSAFGSEGSLGGSKLAFLIKNTNPDVVVLFNDVWVVDAWLKYMPKQSGLKVVAYCPVDAHGYSSRLIQGIKCLDSVATYTNYASQVLLDAGLSMTPIVIGHGVDTNGFRFFEKNHARGLLGLGDDWIVLSTDTNTPRKRLDICLIGFAKFIHRLNSVGQKGPCPVLYLHKGALDTNIGYNVDSLFELLGDKYMFDPDNHLMGTDPRDLPAPDDWLALLYASADIGIKSCWGEGWGLTTFEQALYGAPSILPRHSALGELWGDDNAFMVEPSFELLNPVINTVGRYISSDALAEALLFAYMNQNEVVKRGQAAQEYALDRRWSWDVIGKQFEQWLEGVVSSPKVGH